MEELDIDPNFVLDRSTLLGQILDSESGQLDMSHKLWLLRMCSFSQLSAAHASLKVCQENWLIAKPAVSHSITSKLLKRKHYNGKSIVWLV
jgi:hypothetical protein